MVSDWFEFALFIIPVFLLCFNSLLFDLTDALLLPSGKSLSIFTCTLGLNLFLYLTEREKKVIFFGYNKKILRHSFEQKYDKNQL